MAEKLIQDAIILWATIDPIGTATIFVAVASRLALADRRRLARNATLIATGLLIGFIVVGQLLLSAMGISLAALQIAGGIILFIFGVQMIFLQPGGYSLDTVSQRSNLAVFPLAIPSIASPGAILAVVLRTDNHLHDIGDQVLTTLILLAILAITYLMMIWSHRIYRLIGDQGAGIAAKVMGLVLTALAAELVVDGLRIAFDIA